MKKGLAETPPEAGRQLRPLPSRGRLCPCPRANGFRPSRFLGTTDTVIPTRSGGISIADLDTDRSFLYLRHSNLHFAQIALEGIGQGEVACRGRTMNIVAYIGEGAINRWRMTRNIAAVILGSLYLAIRPRYWPRTVRSVVARQILFTGIEALPLTLLIAVLAGLSIVAQTQLWLNRLGQSGMLGPILVAVIVREIGPLLVTLVIIGRSGTAIATEMAYMTVRKEIDVLDAQGVDPMVYIVMPRVIGVAASVMCLTVCFILFSFASGFIMGVLLGVTPGAPWVFTSSVTQAVTPSVLLNLGVKTLLPGLMVGSICCIEGLSVKGSVTEVPQAATRAVVRTIAATLIVSAITSVLTYV